MLTIAVDLGGQHVDGSTVGYATACCSREEGLLYSIFLGDERRIIQESISCFREYLHFNRDEDMVLTS